MRHIRKKILIGTGIAERVDMDYTLICATHNHEAPDLIGLWGKSRLKSGINKKYMEFVQTQIAKCVEHAVRNLRLTQV
ncbi:hypothetical protein KGY73_09555 [bacterium]|nr:hypothetical protein [bacterium]